jgi:hypothetical protein
VVLGGGGRMGDDEHASEVSEVEEARGPLHRRLLGEQFVLVWGAGILAGGAGAFLVAASPLKGQAIGAAIIGAVCVGIAGRLVEVRAPLPTLMVPVAVLSALGPLVGALLAGGGEAGLATVYRGAIFPISQIVPMDWLAGGFVGVPLGVAWAASMVEKRTVSVASGR